MLVVQEAEEEEDEAAPAAGKDAGTPEPGEGDAPAGDLAADGVYLQFCTRHLNLLRLCQ